MSEHPRELLERYPDLLDTGEQAQLDAHLRECPDCRAWAARLDSIREAASDLGEARFQVQPSEELDQRALARLRSEARAALSVAPRRRWLSWGLAPVLTGVAALLLLFLHPSSPLRDRAPDPGHDPGHDPWWQPKGDDDDRGPVTVLQLALVEGDTTRSLSEGEEVPPNAEILLGGVLPQGIRAVVHVEAGGERHQVWSGIGDARSAEGGALLTGGAPTVIRTPASGILVVELSRVITDGGDEERLQRIELDVVEGG